MTILRFADILILMSRARAAYCCYGYLLKANITSVRERRLHTQHLRGLTNL